MDDATLFGLVAVAGVLVLATGFGLWRRSRDGVAVTEAPSPASRQRAVLAELGIDSAPPVRVTLLQFSSAFCAPCRATRAVCGQLAAERPEVQHLEVDAESRLTAVRELRVLRTPTVFVVAADGRIAARITGQPRRQQVLEAIDPFLTAAPTRAG